MYHEFTRKKNDQAEAEGQYNGGVDNFSLAPSVKSPATHQTFKLLSNIEKSKLQPKKLQNLNKKPDDAFGFPAIAAQVLCETEDNSIVPTSSIRYSRSPGRDLGFKELHDKLNSHLLEFGNGT